MKRKILMMTALIFSSHLFAQRDSSQALQEVVVTANKMERKQSETGKVLTVIGADQLSRNTGRSVSDVLNTVAGTNILGANNAPGTNLTASIRGASAGNTLILLDGIPVSDPSVNSNYFDLNFIAIDQVERIEILKGGQSTLYGSDAVAGVINIITKKGATRPLQLNATLAAGSYGTFKQDLSLSGQKDRFSYIAAYSHLQTKGFSAATDSTGKNDFDKDGTNQHSVHLQTTYRLSDHVRLQLTGRLNKYKSDIDASGYTDEKDFTASNTQAQTGLGLFWKHANGQLQFNYNFNYVERKYFDDSTYRSSAFTDYSRSGYIGRTHFAELYHTYSKGAVDLLTGFDFRAHNTYQHYISGGSWGPYESGPWTGNMHQYSPYASLMLKTTTGFNIEAGGRLNFHSEYGSNFTYNFNPNYRINNNLQIFANYYTAFKAPTLYQLFDPFAGNTNLDPEKGSIAEAGIRLTKDNKWDSRLVGFYRHSKNTIQYITVDPVNFISQYQNISRQDTYGIEWEAGYKWDIWSVRGNYTYTDGSTRSAFDGTGAGLGKDTTYFNLYRIPRHAINLQLQVSPGDKWSFTLQSKWQSEREEFIYGSAPVTLDGYAIVDLYGEYQLEKRVKLFADFRNISNSNYTDWLGFNTRRFNFMAGVQIKW